jgi:cysteine synthase A
MNSVDWSARANIADSVVATAGLTPLVRLSRVSTARAEILGKLEYFGPSGSIKDRPVAHMIQRAIERGLLRGGMRIIEGTTGNTGIATAMVGAALGYPVTIVMPEGMSRERQLAITAYGATLILTPGAESDVDLVLQKVMELRQATPGLYFEVGQFSNQDNVEAHFQTTGPEIWEQSGGTIDAFVAAQGTGGTLTGAGRFLKSQDPQILLYAVEPSECAILSGGSWGAHRIEGIGDGFIPDVLDVALLHGVIQVSSDDAIGMARRLAREEGIFCGISSGCNVVAAIKLSEQRPEMKRIVTIINDNGLRYLTTELMQGEPPAKSPVRDHPALDAADPRLSHLEVIA